MENHKVALIEIAGSHEECLLTQILALKKVNAHITWITSSSMYARNAHLHPYFEEYLLIDVTGKAIADLKKMRAITRFLNNQKISKVVFNTAQGGHVRNLALMLPKTIKAYGIIHTLRKFNGSFTQNIISRCIKKYAVLSDDLLARTQIPKGIQVTSFYPVDFPHFEQKLEKLPGDIYIALTGGVETRRKDLSSLLDLIQKTEENVIFIFLGKTDLSRSDASEFLHLVQANQLEKRIVWFNDFVSQEIFDAYLVQTDFLLPLIHPNTPSAEQYIVNQISGAFLLAYSYGIPLLMHQAYSKEKDLNLSAFFYTLDSFQTDFLTALKERKNLQDRIRSTAKWQADVQHRNYLRFIEIQE